MKKLRWVIGFIAVFLIGAVLGVGIASYPNTTSLYLVRRATRRPSI